MVVDLTKSQAEALNALESGKNVFLTGEAGTGKSFLLRHFVEKNLEKTGKEVLKTAPTGIAALNIDGATLHRTFKLGIDIIDIAENPTFNFNVPEPIKTADVLIIDEISMCRLDVFEKVLKIIKLGAKKSLQVVLVGDFFQLPPVLTAKESEIYEAHFGDKIFAFESALWKEFCFVTKNLTEVVRQKGDLEFIDNLNKARKGDKSCLNYFNKHKQKKKDDQAIHVCGTNKDADNINKKALERLKGPAKCYRAKTKILDDNYSISDKDKAVPEAIELRVGAKVLLTVNLPDLELVNGQIGTVEELNYDYVVVDFDGRVVEIKSYTWIIKAYETVIVDDKKKSKLVEIAKYSQIPVKLAYAITIHKSQGQTFEKAVIHPRSWSPGQLYVALSRVSNINGLYLTQEIQQDWLFANQKVIDFYNSPDSSDDESAPLPTPTRKRKRRPGGGRKRKFSGMETKVMRLLVEYESLLLQVAEVMSENDFKGDCHIQDLIDFLSAKF